MLPERAEGEKDNSHQVVGPQYSIRNPPTTLKAEST